MTELKDWLNSINQTKKNLIDEDPSIEKEYPPYIVNRCFSGHIDTLMFANEMNKYHFLDKDIQFNFLINSIRPKKRFGGKWIKQQKLHDLENVKEYYGYSNEKARQALSILSKEQIEKINKACYKGGRAK